MISVHDLRHVDADVAEAWLKHIAENMRQADIDEVSASSGMDPHEALMVSFRLSSHAWVFTGQGGGAIGVFGVVPHSHLPDVGIVWMLGTDDIKTEALGIARRTRPYIREMNEAYGLLWNYVDARNETSIRWLKWGGFRLLEPHRFGDHLFYSFARSNYV